MQIDEGFAEDDLETNLQRDKHARLCSMVNQLIDELTPSAPDFQLRDACDQMVSTEYDDVVLIIEQTTDHHHDGESGNVVPTRLFAWYASNFGSVGREMFSGCVDEAASYN